MRAQSPFAHDRRPYARSNVWGPLALAAWCSLALHLSGVLSFDALNPMHLLGCAPHTRALHSASIPSHVSPGLVLVRGAEAESLPPGSVVVLGRDPFALVGVDYSVGVIVVQDRVGGLLSIPADRGTLRIQRVRSGVRVGARIAGIAGGVVGGMVTGLAIGVAADRGPGLGSATANGCLLGGLAGASIGTTSSIMLTRDRRYRLGPDDWQVARPPQHAEQAL